MQSALDDLFGHYFELLEADTPELRDEVFRLRYQVYCLETGFEDKEQFPDGRERDPFDSLARYALVRRRGSNVAVATVRLVGADLSREDTVFPLEQPYPGLLAARGFGPDKLPRGTTAEISRFAISRQFKRRVGEPGTLAGVSEANVDGGVDPRACPSDRRAEPFIIMGLFKAIFRLSIENGYTHWVAAMEPALLRLLSRFGIKFVRIGAPITFHGTRQPCMGCLGEMYDSVYRSRRDVWNFVTECGRLRPRRAPGKAICVQDASIRAAG
ncbi:MAG TPA: PEP-CTERM/exosortase system-associated acyltransferase [Gammaproteobacteria bacterium]|nr:PEP-CTERM/exosortase system-associated acyltransferase [Gammaproteobacteria bacterium]